MKHLEEKNYNRQPWDEIQEWEDADFDVENSWQRMAQRLDNKNDAPKKTTVKFSWQWLRVAIFLIGVGMGLFVWLQHGNSTKSDDLSIKRLAKSISGLKHSDSALAITDHPNADSTFSVNKKISLSVKNKAIHQNSSVSNLTVSVSIKKQIVLDSNKNAVENNIKQNPALAVAEVQQIVLKRKSHLNVISMSDLEKNAGNASNMTPIQRTKKPFIIQFRDPNAHSVSSSEAKNTQHNITILKF